MRVLSGSRGENAWNYLEIASEEAKKSSCFLERRGCVLVLDYNIVGRGHNSPPKFNGLTDCPIKSLSEFSEFDKKCCVYAEDRAIRDALRDNVSDISNATMYLMLLDVDGRMKKFENFYDSNCSNSILDEGIKNIVLWRKEGICIYEPHEFNNLSV